ncbi:ATP-binding protein [Pontibacterium granulatum]|uniref:ATP-binding protein n=1 Tax=Pontibacterium granulatum TaxID=2036029 RepID=UPI00249B12EA|nr:ATP-binding protein [Pontibacterium granulatum]MDI3325150.1 ATP-binding protein [Pontibacterium granulatum]
MDIQPLASQALYSACDETTFTFSSTAELDPLPNHLGQARAKDAIRFAVEMPSPGYNLYVTGPTGIGKLSLVKGILEQHPKDSGAVFDWCYINNFDTPSKPHALRLQKGIGRQLQKDMTDLVERLLVTLPATLQSDEYHRRVNELQEEYHEREEQLFSDLGREAKERKLTLMRTATGYTIAPTRDGKLITTKEFNALTEQEQAEMKAGIDVINDKLKASVRTLNSWQEESVARVKELNRSFIQQAVEPAIDYLKSRYEEHPGVDLYLDSVQSDIESNASDFMPESGEDNTTARQASSTQFNRYKVNVLVDNSATTSAPVVYLDQPNLQNLIGRIEHISQFGTLMTNFTLIQPGALHKANGGFLIIDAFHLLSSGFSWPALKRALKSGEIRIESIHEMLSLSSTISLEPEPIPTNAKVILCGDRLLYHLLKEYDPDFGLLFKVQADMEDSIDRSPEACQHYARIIAALGREANLLPLAPGGVAQIIEFSARRMEHSHKLSLHMARLIDLIHRADHEARQQNSTLIERKHVKAALDRWLWHSNRYQQLIQELISEETLKITTHDSEIAQINGLSVVQLGDFYFGRPSRITATARLGNGKILDIERESDMGGDIHSKAVMITSALLASRYARNTPLALSATLVFEQSYGGIEGDSASVAEMLALLSAITGIPLKQNLAVTGSLNQLGEVQAIGGVNEKIEGFFDICKARGLNGSHGVAIPANNIRHLMLREEVREACAEGQFTIYPLDTLDDAITLFTDIPAGTSDAEGTYPQDSFNDRVMKQLAHFCDLKRQLLSTDQEKEADKRD